MKRLVFISFGQLNQNLHKALCIDDFLAAGIEVVYLDITSILFSNLTIKHEYPFIISMKSYQILEEYLAENTSESTFFNVQINYEYRFLKLFRLLKKYNCKKVIFEIGYLPEPNFKNNLFKYFKNPIYTIKRIFEKTMTKICNRLGFIYLDYDIKFAAGKVALSNSHKNAKQVVEINFVDYERYLELDQKHNINEEYCVFLDIYLHAHQDHTFSINNNMHFDAQKYLNELNNFFSYIEERLHVKVVIAAHPKSNYSANEFNNRAIIKNETLTLVSKAKFVLSHHSTSISYAVLCQKPVIFFYTDDIQQNMNFVYLYTKSFAKYLHMPFVNASCIEETELFYPKINPIKYKDYKYDYLTTENIELLTNKQIIERFIKEKNELDI